MAYKMTVAQFREWLAKQGENRVNLWRTPDSQSSEVRADVELPNGVMATINARGLAQDPITGDWFYARGDAWTHVRLEGTWRDGAVNCKGKGSRSQETWSLLDMIWAGLAYYCKSQGMR